MSLNFQQAEPLDSSSVDAVPYIPDAPSRPDHILFVRAILFGLGGAIAGGLIYAVFVGLTHITIGYLAVLVAYLIAKAMTTGSKGQGGRAYQITAVLLTYIAVCAAKVAILLWSLSRAGDHFPFSFRMVIALIQLGLKFPFLEFESSPGGALLGLFILFIGMSAAWRMTSGIPGAVRQPFAR